MTGKEGIVTTPSDADELGKTPELEDRFGPIMDPEPAVDIIEHDFTELKALLRKAMLLTSILPEFDYALVLEVRNAAEALLIAYDEQAAAADSLTAPPPLPKQWVGTWVAREREVPNPTAQGKERRA